MKKTFLKLMSVLMALVLCLGIGATAVFANEEGTTEEVTTNWYGDEVVIDVAAGKDSYTFLSVYVSPRHAYEMSGHMVSTDGGASNDIPQTLVMIDASSDYTWTPDGLYTFGQSNYEVLYCCDAETGYGNGIYYKRLNLEDSDYYTPEEAAHIRSIVTNSYPYISLEQMKANLEEAGFEGAQELTRSEIITAVQSAIWYYANGEDFRYSQTFDVPSNSQWGGVMHDFNPEMEIWWQTGKRKFSKDEAVAARINGLIDYLRNLEGTYAEKNQIVISEIEVLETVPVQEKDGVFTIALRVALNNSGSSELDDISLDIYVGDTLVTTTPIELGTDEYFMTVEAVAGQTVKAVVNGTQMLPQGVYFYEPEGGREVSQCLVGVAGGLTNVYAEASVTPDIPEGTNNTFKMSIHKIDENGESLTGAAFNLYYSVDGVNYLVGAYEVDELGMIQVEDLLPGEYVLTETKTPFAHISLSGDIRFTILEDGTLEGLQLPEGVSVNSQEGVIDVTVINERVSTSAQLDGIKYLDGEVAGGFEFALSFNGNIIETVFSNEDGTFSFSPLFFNEAGTYTFEVFEVFVDTDEDLMIYDETVYTVTITVTLSEDGQAMTAVVEGAENIEFYNETETIIPDEPVPENPPTGDGIHTAFFAAIASLMLLGTCIVLKRKEC